MDDPLIFTTWFENWRATTIEGSRFRDLRGSMMTPKANAVELLRIAFEAGVKVARKAAATPHNN